MKKKKNKLNVGAQSNSNKVLRKLAEMPVTQINKLIKLCKIQSSLDNEKRMVLYLASILNAGNNIAWEIDPKGNILVTKGCVKTYPCVVSHLDTVHGIVEESIDILQFIEDETSDFIIGATIKQGVKTSEKIGIGGDDKCGIFACLYFLMILPAVKVVFFTGEEMGCIGSKGVNLEFFDDCRYIIQLDRRGGSDFIDKYCGDNTISKSFSSEVGHLKKEFGFKSSLGTVTDVMKLYSRNVNLSVVNISSGYYLPHTNNEYINVNELWNSVCFVKGIIKTLRAERYINIPIKKKYNFITYNNKVESISTSYKRCIGCNGGTLSYKGAFVKNLGGFYCYKCISFTNNGWKLKDKAKKPKEEIANPCNFDKSKECNYCEDYPDAPVLRCLNIRTKEEDDKAELVCASCLGSYYKEEGLFEGDVFYCEPCKNFRDVDKVGTNKGFKCKLVDGKVCDGCKDLDKFTERCN